MKNKSDKQLLSELIDSRDKCDKLRKEIDKRDRESGLKRLKKYVGNYYRNTTYGKGTYCYILSIDKDCLLTGTTLHKYSNKHFSLEFNDTIYPGDGEFYSNLRKISKEKWENIILRLKPEINKGIN